MFLIKLKIDDSANTAKIHNQIKKSESNIFKKTYSVDKKIVAILPMTKNPRNIIRQSKSDI